MKVKKKKKNRKPDEVKLPEKIIKSFLAKQLNLKPDEMADLIIKNYKDALSNIRSLNELN